MFTLQYNLPFKFGPGYFQILDPPLITPNTINTIRNAHLFTPQIRSNLAQNPF